MRYVCNVRYYANCRAHDGATSYHLKFYNSLEEILDHMLKNINDSEIFAIYSTHNGSLISQPKYEVSGHSCSGISVRIKTMKIRTSDNGHGKLVWKSN